MQLGELGKVKLEIFQWNGQVVRGLPNWTSTKALRCVVILNQTGQHLQVGSRQNDPQKTLTTTSFFINFFEIEKKIRLKRLLTQAQPHKFYLCSTYPSNLESIKN